MTQHESAPPRITIGLPVHDGAGYLPRALESLLGQTRRDIEIVVSDNASTDGTGGMVSAYAARDPRVRHVAERVNRGGIWNFNRVLELAQTEYFKWAAHDDLCEPEFVERCVEVLDSDPSVVCCHARTRKIDADGAIVDALPDPTRASEGGADPRASARFRDVLLNTGYGARCYGVFRTDVLRRIRPLMPIYGSEKVFMAEVALHGRIVDVDEVLFYERVHAGNVHARESSAGQQAFVDPGSDVPLFPRLRLLGGYLRAIARTPLGPIERFRCLAAIGAYLFQVRKWRSVAQSALQGTGAVRHDGNDTPLVTARGASA